MPSPQVSSSPSSQAAADAGLQQQIADSSQNAVSQPPATQAAADAGLQQQIADSSQSVPSQPPAMAGNSSIAASPSSTQDLQNPFGDAAASRGGAMPQRYQPAWPPKGVLNNTAAASQSGIHSQISSPVQATQGLLNTTGAASPSWSSPALQGGAQSPTQQPDQASLVDPGATVAAPAATQAQTPAQQQL